MTENNHTQDNQADLNKSQQPEAGAARQDQNDQSQNKGKPGQEEKTFQTGQADLEAKPANPDIEADAGIDDEARDAQSETSNT